MIMTISTVNQPSLPMVASPNNPLSFPFINAFSHLLSPR
jgi:hypothetical protein